MGPVKALIIRRPLATFFVGSVGLGWLVTIASAQLSSNPLVLPLIAIPVSYVPAIMAWFVLRVAGTPHERLAWRRRLTRVRVGWQWYAVGLLILPLVHLVGVAIATLWGGSCPVAPRAHCAAATLPPNQLRRGDRLAWLRAANAPGPDEPARRGPRPWADLGRVPLGCARRQRRRAARLRRRQHDPADRDQRDHVLRLQRITQISASRDVRTRDVRHRRDWCRSAHRDHRAVAGLLDDRVVAWLVVLGLVAATGSNLGRNTAHQRSAIASA